MKLSVFLCTLIATAGFLAGPSVAGADEPARPNIVFAFADDWGWPHAGAYGDATVRTPTFDRVAREGVLFEHAFISSPSCTPARGAVLSGQDFWRLGEAANLWSHWPADVAVYPDLLADEAGYFVGRMRKAWGPGDIGDREHNPAGPNFQSFQQFLEQRPDGRPFCFWFGTSDPHRPFNADLREREGVDPDDVVVPPVFPDAAAVREDIADYYAEVQRFDREVGEVIALLEERGELENTIIVISGDHGWPFPRGKGNLYDLGARVPLAILWPAQMEAGGRTLSDFVNITDLAPTFLEAAGVEIPEQMTGRSLVPLLTGDADGRVDAERDHVVIGRERHVPAQEEPNSGGYPARAIRDERYLYIRNFFPNRWPAGTPDYENAYRGNAWHADTDNGPTKFYLWAHRDDPRVGPLYDLAFARRPAEELYDIANDPFQMRNVAGDPAYADVKAELAARLMDYLHEADDPRAADPEIDLDDPDYLGGAPQWPGRDVIDRYR